MGKIEVMNRFAEQLIGEDVNVGELLYECYASRASMDNDLICKSFLEIEECTAAMPFDMAEHISSAVIAACVECERLAFLDGVALGTKLMLEFMER